MRAQLQASSAIEYLSIRTHTSRIVAAVSIMFDGYLRLGDTLSVTSPDVRVLKRSHTLDYPQVSVTLFPHAAAAETPHARTNGGEFHDTAVLGESVAQVGTCMGRKAPHPAEGDHASPLAAGPGPGARFRARRVRRRLKDARLRMPRGTPHGLRHGGPSID